MDSTHVDTNEQSRTFKISTAPESTGFFAVTDDEGRENLYLVSVWQQPLMRVCFRDSRPGLTSVSFFLMAMPLSVLFSQIRLVLEGSQGAPSQLELIGTMDEFVHAVDPDSVPSADIEEELQTIHRDVADHSSPRQAEGFLAVLYHLRPLLSSASVILLWFDLILRPALREPKLSTNAIDNATDLIVSALRNEDNTHQQKSDDFRQRIVDYYLLDAFNEGSGDDMILWAELDESEKEGQKCWKTNLENILLKYGTKCPEVRQRYARIL